MAIAAFIAAVYLLFLVVAIFAWATYSFTGDVSSATKVSILIAARNEEDNLPRLIKSIEGQNCAVDALEVIVVDDHSEDQTLAILEHWKLYSKWPITVLQSKRRSSRPKMEALNLAIEKAKGDILLFTDADCAVTSNWVEAMNAAFNSGIIQLAFGPIKYEDGNFLERLLSIEQAALLGSALASLKLGIPSMCNGANMAIRRSTFLEIGGFESLAYSASGDDELLLHKVFLNDPQSVAFVKSKEAIVCTETVKSLSQLFQQRRRWAGKWEKYILFRTKLFALFVFMFHLTWLGLLIGSFFLKGITCLFLLLLPLKLLLEGAFIFQVSHFLGKKVNWIAFGLQQLVYSPYVVFFAIVSRRKGFKWKGRQLE